MHGGAEASPSAGEMDAPRPPSLVVGGRRELARPREGADHWAMVERRTRRSQVPDGGAHPVPRVAARKCLDRPRPRSRHSRDGRLLAAAGPSPEQLARTVLQVHEAREANATEKTAQVATWWLRAGGFEVILASRGGD